MKIDFKLPRKLKLSGLKLPSLPLDLRKVESLEREHYKIIVFGLALVIVIMVVSGLTAFFLSIRGEEQTMVPDVNGMELSQALVKLQDKELYPRISLRFTDNPADRGKVVEQKPAPGSIVKAGRRIQLSVSRGAVADRVENFVGQDLNEAKTHLLTLFAATRPLISVKEPPIYVFDKTPAGTILEQKPLPDTEIAGPIQIEFVVSRGPEQALVKVPDFAGLSFRDAVVQVEKADLAVKFSMRPAAKGEKAGVVASQTPTGGTMIQAAAVVSVVLTSPAPEKGIVADVYARELPVYPYPLKVSLEAIDPDGERSPVMTVDHSGGLFTAPYALPEGSVLVLTVLDREVPPRVQVKKAE